MKKNLFLVSLFCFLFGCEQQDIRTQAANIIYRYCIEEGASQRWCRCLREDLKTSFSEEKAYYIVKGQYRPDMDITINGARLRCQCRINPARFEIYGLSCDGVKPLNF